MVSPCIICKKEMTNTGLKHHLFSGFHAKDIINAIHSKKSIYLSWLEKLNSNPKSCGFPKLYLTKTPNVSHEFCHPCKRFREVKTNRPIECDDSHKKATADFIKECLAKEPSIPIVEEVQAPKISADDMSALKKQNARLVSLSENQKNIISDLTDYEDALTFLFTQIKDSDTDLFNRFREQHSAVYEKEIKKLEEED